MTSVQSGGVFFEPPGIRCQNTKMGGQEKIGQQIKHLFHYVLPKIDITTENTNTVPTELFSSVKCTESYGIYQYLSYNNFI